MDYIDIINSDYFKKTYTKIEEIKKDYPVNHGFIHIYNVIENAKKLSITFNLNEKETSLLLIAASLHDIGYIKGREEHAYNGSVLASKILKQWNFTKEDINAISIAIKNHGGRKQEEYLDKISMCLIIADKLDFIKTRYDISRLNDIKTQLYPYIENTFIDYKNDHFNLNIVINEGFSITTFESLSFYLKLSNFLSLLSKHLDCGYSIKYITR